MASHAPAPVDAASDGSQRKLVETSYDEIAENYHQWTAERPSPRVSYIEKLLPLLPSNARILELGCGSGVPATHILGSHGRKVVAVDISSSMISLAKRLLAETADPKPNIEFVKADLMDLTFPGSSFDAVAGFYSVIHLPRYEQEVLLRRVAEWLKPGGHLLLTMSATDSADSYEAGWCGAKSNTEMYWSGHDAETNKAIVGKTGFEILDGTVIVDHEDEGHDVPFLWVLARRPLM